jgi:DNA-binding NarL/FixJ family response regulator
MVVGSTDRGGRPRGAEDRGLNGPAVHCVLLADRHHGLTEGLRGLLATAFRTVVMVADEPSLVEAAERLRPALAVVDLSLVHGASLRWLERLRARCPALKLVAISVHDEPTVRRKALEAGADGFVLKRDLATELLPAIETILGAPGPAPAGAEQ